jgi:hypothetical protein
MTHAEETSQTQEKDLSYIPDDVVKYLHDRGCIPLGRGEAAKATGGWWVDRRLAADAGQAYSIDLAFFRRGRNGLNPGDFGSLTAGAMSSCDQNIVLVLWRYMTLTEIGHVLRFPDHKPTPFPEPVAVLKRSVEAVAGVLRLQQVPTGLNAEQANRWSKALGELESSLQELQKLKT